jgi:endogenous inhibitor of DNA gyrase (YacG/DUF329 family)
MASRRCPQCRSEAEWEGNPHRPFCSERCRLVDLQGWLGERYAIAGEPEETDLLEDSPDESAGAGNDAEPSRAGAGMKSRRMGS